jgi:hypothetical protein
MPLGNTLKYFEFRFEFAEKFGRKLSKIRLRAMQRSAESNFFHWIAPFL